MLPDDGLNRLCPCDYPEKFSQAAQLFWQGVLALRSLRFLL